tara:strand:- start:73 stop:240 length:168 start_codon:yes stop_codon:yes gene_type:complete
MRKITDEELISFFNGLKSIIEAQKELNHIMAQRVTNLELQRKINKLKESEVADVV